MSSQNAEIEDVLSSIRRLIDARKPEAQPLRPAPQATDQPAPAPHSTALLLSPAQLVSLPPRPPARPAGTPEHSPEATTAPAVHASPIVNTWAKHSTRMPPVAETELTRIAIAAARASTARRGPYPQADADIERSDAVEAATAKPTPLDSPHGTASQAQPASVPLAAAQATAPGDGTAATDGVADTIADDSLEALSALFGGPAPLPPAPTPPSATALPGAGASHPDDDLAEHLADVVRAQIALTLPRQISALAPQLLDESILRPIVADMIRQELAGPLGERITHGVRKLVRQELQRAIALRRLQ